MITNKMNKIIQYLKMLSVLLVDYIKFLYRFMTLTFFITILSLIFDYIYLPAAAKPYYKFNHKTGFIYNLLWQPLITRTNDHTNSKSLKLDIKWEVYKRT